MSTELEDNIALLYTRVARGAVKQQREMNDLEVIMSALAAICTALHEQLKGEHDE